MSYQAQLNCAKIVPKGPITEALGMEEKMMMMWNPATWPYASLPLYQHIWQQYIHRSPRKSSETTSAWLLMVRSCLLVYSGIIALHYIVWAAVFVSRASLHRECYHTF